MELKNKYYRSASEICIHWYKFLSDSDAIVVTFYKSNDNAVSSEVQRKNDMARPHWAYGNIHKLKKITKKEFIVNYEKAVSYIHSGAN